MTTTPQEHRHSVNSLASEQRQQAASAVAATDRNRGSRTPTKRKKNTTPKRTIDQHAGSIPATLLLLLCCIFTTRCCTAFTPVRSTFNRGTASSAGTARGGVAVVRLVLPTTTRPALLRLWHGRRPSSSDDHDRQHGSESVTIVVAKQQLGVVVPDQTKSARTAATSTTTTGTTISTFFASFVRENEQNDFYQAIERRIDAISGGWALSYADLSPDSETTAGGRAFLATNLAYGVVGLIVSFYVGDYLLGFLTELCALASYNYHYYQLLAHGQAKADSVRLALLIDYVFAGASILTSLVYMGFIIPAVGVPTTAVAAALLGVAFLLASWNWEYGRPYMVLHGLWHLCSAVAGYLIADAYHQSSLSVVGGVVGGVSAVASTAGTMT